VLIAVHKRFNSYSPRKRRLIILVGIIVGIILVLGISFAVYAGRVFYIKTVGILVTPSQDYEVRAVQYYLQNDPDWSGDTIGHSQSSLGGTGCLIACVASGVTDLGVPVTPKELNQQLTVVDGFEVDNLIWYKINEAFPEVNYTYDRVFSAATLEKDLRAGRLPIINVKYHGNGVTHWVMVVGAKDGEFLVYDPANGDKKPIPLSVHGRVYAYRVLVPIAVG